MADSKPLITGNSIRTENRPHSIEYVDFAKGYAMLTVVLFHFFFGNIVFGNLLDKAVFFGGSGIHLYFFLSGFGLTLGRKVPPLEFYRRRFTKIFLPYMFFVSFAFVLGFFYRVSVVQGWWAYLSHLFLFKMFDKDLMASYGYQLWFMSTLIQFYLVFPLLLAVKEKLGSLRWLALATLVSLAYFGFVYASRLNGNTAWVTHFPQFLWEFALGMTLADVYRNKNFRFWDWSPGWYACLAVLGVGAMGYFTLTFGEGVRAFNDIPAFLGYASLSILDFQFTRKYLPWLKNAFMKLGDVSFFLYLTHVLVVQVLMERLRANGWEPSVFHLLLYLPLALLVAIGFQYFYSKVASSFNRKALQPN